MNVEIREAKSKYFCEKIEHCTLSNNVKKTWSLINAISGRKRKSANVKDLLINDTIVSDDKTIAESFNDYFTNITVKLAAESEQLYANNLGDEPTSHQHCPGTHFYFSEISASNVALRLQNLKASKATGMDNILAKALKVASYIIAPSLTVIFRQSLSTGIYINDWKLARVSPIYKQEDRKNGENYRTISIPPIISTVFVKEKCLPRFINILRWLTTKKFFFYFEKN